MSAGLRGLASRYLVIRRPAKRQKLGLESFKLAQQPGLRSFPYSTDPLRGWPRVSFLTILGGQDRLFDVMEKRRDLGSVVH